MRFTDSRKGKEWMRHESSMEGQVGFTGVEEVKLGEGPLIDQETDHA